MELKNTFNEVAPEYDKYRPNYPTQLFLDILEYASITPSHPILEIGCGTGQATKGFVDLGYDHVTCIELGQKLAEFTREKFKANTNVNIINSSFEEWQSAKKQFDLIISATAFHFIQPSSSGIGRHLTCSVTKDQLHCSGRFTFQHSTMFLIKLGEVILPMHLILMTLMHQQLSRSLTKGLI
ncbi:class I SAM-dependent DNA methyltransferase [Paenibacillus solisilvae]|uniref:Class I SAM-dependent DNA methyltransferase n=1 Tax=Paenibacillus solisilvae TaxID=2486751 RepID=A0ABW0W9C5_9BACL